MTIRRRSFRSAPAVLSMADKAVWVTGWNEAVDALEAEQAQAVEPVGYFCSNPAGDFSYQVSLQAGYPGSVPHYTHPAPPATPTLKETLAAHGVKLRTEFEPKPRDHVEDALAMVGKAQQALSLELLERLSKTLTNLGYSTPEGGMEHFVARIESQLYNLCRGVDSLLAQQVAVADGWAIVPIEPTGEMLVATNAHPGAWTALVIQYKAMLAAAQGAKP